VETVLVGRVFDGDGGAVRRGVRESALHHLRPDYRRIIERLTPKTLRREDL